MSVRNKWRLLGLSCLAGALILVLYSGAILQPEIDPLWVSLFWGGLLFLLVTAVYIAFIDLRYTRLQYKLGERELFRETFLDDAFREAVREIAGKTEEKEPAEKDG